jgi:hypothetical protein
MWPLPRTLEGLLLNDRSQKFLRNVTDKVRDKIVTCACLSQKSGKFSEILRNLRSDTSAHKTAKCDCRRESRDSRELLAPRGVQALRQAMYASRCTWWRWFWPPAGTGASIRSRVRGAGGGTVAMQGHLIQAQHRLDWFVCHALRPKR